MSDRTRREFVVLALSGLGATIALSACRDQGIRALSFRPRVDPGRLSDDWIEIESTLHNYFGAENLGRVRWVGRAYVQRFSPDVDALIADLSEAVSVLEATGGRQSGPATLDGAIRKDFEEGELVSVYGWQLARSEARLAALLDVTLPAELPEERRLRAR